MNIGDMLRLFLSMVDAEYKAANKAFESAEASKLKYKRT
jgi:hypothetical protein